MAIIISGNGENEKFQSSFLLIIIAIIRFFVIVLLEVDGYYNWEIDDYN